MLRLSFLLQHDEKALETMKMYIWTCTFTTFNNQWTPPDEQTVASFLRRHTVSFNTFFHRNSRQIVYGQESGRQSENLNTFHPDENLGRNKPNLLLKDPFVRISIKGSRAWLTKRPQGVMFLRITLFLQISQEV